VTLGWLISFISYGPFHIISNLFPFCSLYNKVKSPTLNSFSLLWLFLLCIPF
jgi:hypothetical protein